MLLDFIAAVSQTAYNKNNPPQVTITAPAANAKLKLNAIVPYSIQVIDQEDGSTAYNEITANEVLFMVRHLPDSSQVGSYLMDQSRPSPLPLLWMGRSGCFACHSAKARLIGPSFELIAQRYPYSKTAVDHLSGKIIAGTSGTWGDLIMPSHPDMTPEQTAQIVSWILLNATNADMEYFAGLEGSFRTGKSSQSVDGKGVYVLTATYLDHGLPDFPSSVRQGGHNIVLKIAKE